MRIAVMGSGGLGGLFGGLFQQAGADVLFIARGAHLEAMQTSGLKVLSELGDVSLDKVAAVADPSGQAPADFVIFTVKGQDTRPAAELIAPIVGPDTAIISFQNGVEGLDILAERFGTQTIVPGTTFTPGTLEAPGIIRHGGLVRSFTVGEWDGPKSTRLQTLVSLSEKAGIGANISENVRQEAWIKFIAFATYSALTCLTRQSIFWVAEQPSTRDLAIKSMSEILTVAKARGVDLPEGIVERLIARGRATTDNWKTSMCNDLEVGKPIELETTSGAIRRMGQALGVPTPFHDFAYQVLLPFAAPLKTG